MPTGSQEPHQQDVAQTSTADDTDDDTVYDGEHERGDMGGNTGRTQPSTRGGGGLGPAQVREAEDKAAGTT